MSGKVIAFRCEDTLLTFKESSFTDKILNSVLGKAKRAELNHSVCASMEYLYRNTEYTIDLVVKKENYTTELKKVLDDLPFCRILLVEKEVEISQRLLIGDLYLYVDNNEQRRKLISSEYAIPIDQLSNFVKRG